MVRGGSSPLGRIEKALLTGLFLRLGPDLADSVRVHDYEVCGEVAGRYLSVELLRQPGERTSKAAVRGDWDQGRRGCRRRFAVVACERAAHLPKVHQVYLLDNSGSGGVA
jgi:hypothetical protein